MAAETAGALGRCRPGADIEIENLLNLAEELLEDINLALGTSGVP